MGRGFGKNQGKVAGKVIAPEFLKYGAMKVIIKKK